MGVIQRQGLKNALANYSGTLIGFISILFIVPLNTDLYGYAQFVHSWASLLMPILGFGVHGAILRYFPAAQKENKQEYFLAHFLTMSTVVAVLMSLLLVCVKIISDSYLEVLFDDYKLFSENAVLILTLAWLFLYIAIFYYYANAQLRIVIPDILQNIGFKIFLPSAILLSYFSIIDYYSFKLLIIFYFVGVLIAMAYYGLSLSSSKIQLQKHWFKQDWLKGLGTYMGFASLNAIGTTLAFRVDIIMIGMILGKKMAGIYGVILVISNVMDIPSKALNQISSPIIAKSWIEGDISNIRKVYHEASLINAIIGIFFMGLLYLLWPDFLRLMPKSLGISIDEILVIFFFLALAKYVDMVTSINTVIISYSPSFKYNLYFLLVLALSNTVLNYYLITHQGILGVAMASLSAMILYNLAKSIFIYRKYDIGLDIKWPLLLMLIASAVVHMCHMFIPFIALSFMSLITNAGIFTLLFGGLVWILNPAGVARKYLVDVLNYLHAMWKRSL